MGSSAEYHLRFIQPGKPLQNALIEQYNWKVRYDWVGLHLFTSLDELQGYATRRQWFYNHERPNMPLLASHLCSIFSAWPDSAYLRR